MDSKKCSKIRDIVRLQLVLKRWRKQASCNSEKDTITKENKKSRNNNTNGMKFLKKTLSFSDTRASLAYVSDNQLTDVPKGYLAVCVGKEEVKRFVIPMHYLSHDLFVMLLREAEEEFGFQNEGVLRIPCKVDVFEKVLRWMEGDTDEDSLGSCSQKTSVTGELCYDPHYCY